MAWGGRLTLERRVALVALPLVLFVASGLWLVERLLVAPAYESWFQARLDLRLEARARPLTTRLEVVATGLEAAADAVAHLPAPALRDRIWDERATSLLRRWPEIADVARLETGQDSHRPWVVHREGARFTAERRADGGRFLAVVRGVGGPDHGHSPASEPVVSVEVRGDERHVWLVRGSRDGHVVVGARLRPGTWARALGLLSTNRRAETWLVDAGGRGLSTRGNGAFGPSDPTAAADTDDDRWFAARHAAPDVGLSITHRLPREAALAPYVAARNAVAASIAALVLVVFAIVHRLSRDVTVPLSRLSTTMRTVAAGDLSQRLPVNGPAEIADLARSFNTMISDLHTTHVALRSQSERLAVALREVEDVEAMKDSFLALVSHEVRTPLTSILGGVEFLREEFRDQRSEMETEFIEIVHDSARRLAGFMNDAILMASLQASRSQSGFEMFSLTGVLRSKLGELESYCHQQGVIVENRADAQREFLVHGDWTLMQVALEKVLHNAVRHNHDEGRVVIELVERVLEDPDGDLRRTMAARGVEPPDTAMRWRALRIFNTGPVIPTERVDQIFERFELTHDIDNHQRGSGLSLPIANYVLTYHGGCIEVRAVDDLGMAFYLVLAGRVGPQPRGGNGERPEGVDDTVAAAQLAEVDGALDDGAGRGAPSPDGSEEVLAGDHADVEPADVEPAGERVVGSGRRTDA